MWLPLVSWLVVGPTMVGTGEMAPGDGAEPAPPQRIVDVVRTLSRQTDTPLVVSPGAGEIEVHVDLAPGNVEDALMALSKAAPVTYRRVGEGFVVVLAAAPPPADAIGPALSPPPADTIVVTGFWPSVTSAVATKKASDGIIETILAEDIARFPDLNLAESLQRLPGVAISREAGEGRRIFLRGLAPSFTRVQLNGMEVLANIDSPMDSRGQNTRDRAFDFNIFASDLFDRVDVEKSYSAEMEEGGIAGRVILRTPKPLSLPDTVGTLTVQGGTNDWTDEAASGRVTGLFSRSNDMAGALVSFAYSERDTVEEGVNTYRWRLLPDPGADLSDLSLIDQAAIAEGAYRFPRGNRYSVWEAEQRRLGVTAAAEWQPSPAWNLSADLLFGRFEADRQERHLASRGSASTWLSGPFSVDGEPFGPARVTEIEVMPNGDVVFLSVEDAVVTTEVREQKTRNDFRQAVVASEWSSATGAQLRTLIGWERSDYDIPADTKVYLETVGDVASDYRGGGLEAVHHYGFDPTDLDRWRVHEIDLATASQSTQLQTAKADFSVPLGERLSMTAGIHWRSFENDGRTQAAVNLLLEEFEDGRVDDDPAGFISVYKGHQEQDWAIASVAKALPSLGIRPSVEIAAAIPQQFSVAEEVWAGYFQLNAQREFPWGSLSGDAGIRYFNTMLTSEGVTNVGPLTVIRDDDGWLPALNVTTRIGEGHVLRLGLSRNISRPPLEALGLAGSIVESDGSITLVDVGNPYLDAFGATNVDLSYERYFGEAGLIAAAVFVKDVEGFIGTETLSNVPFETTGLPATIRPGIMPSTPVENFSRPVNVEQTTILGLELSAQTSLGFFSRHLRDFGLIANATIVDGELDYASPAEKAAGIERLRTLEGLSTESGNLTVFYERDRWGARLSTNYRSDYVQKGTPTGTDEDRNGFEASTYVDAAAHFVLTPTVRLTFDATNLTDEKVAQYSDAARRLYNVTASGRSYYLGLRLDL